MKQTVEISFYFSKRDLIPVISVNIVTCCSVLKTDPWLKQMELTKGESKEEKIL